VIVIDDSAEGSAKRVIEEFPGDIVYARTEGYMGPALGRNLGARMATAEVLVHLDDDSELISDETLHSAVRALHATDVGAVAIPYRNVEIDEQIHCAAPETNEIYETYAFTACAYAVRRDVFLNIGGYRPFFFYMGEESDLCLRMLAAGWLTRLGNGPPVHHHQPANRVSRAADYYGRRNEVLFEVLNAPVRCLPGALLRYGLKAIHYGIHTGRPLNMVRGYISGLFVSFAHIRHRKPVPIEIYRRFKSLVRKPSFK